MSNYKYFLLAVLASAAPIGMSRAAIELPIVRVTYQDLNLATAAGVSTLFQRLQLGAAKYCEPFKDVPGTFFSVEFNRCVKDAVASTVKKLDNTRLSAFYISQRGKSAG